MIIGKEIIEQHNKNEVENFNIDFDFLQIN
jgi:L-rhamnose isomerase/sugar isomerase